MFTRKKIILYLSVIVALTACEKSNKEQTKVISNGKITFTRYDLLTGNYCLFTANPDGTGLTALTQNSVLDAHPSWSSDGKKVVFTRQVNGNFDIYTMNADGSGIIRLTTDTASDLVPSFSPDGSNIVFESNRLNGVYQIFLMNADGSNQRAITATGIGTTNYGGKYSPDGTKIAFASNRDDDPNDNIVHNDIYLVKPDGSNVTRLTYNMDNEAGRSWSPDGKQLVFSSVVDSVAQLFIINADGSGQSQITNSIGNPNPLSPGGFFPVFRGEVTPTWSPDGSRISFASDRNLNYEIYTVKTDGTAPIRITNSNTTNLSTGWQPIVNVQ